MGRLKVNRKNYQLLGVTSLLIAAKYEEIYPPRINDLVYITDSAYNKEQIQKFEYEVLEALDFHIAFPSQYRFLERYAHISECDIQVFYMAQYMLELSLLEVSMNKWSPSLLATSSIYVSKKINNI